MQEFKEILTSLFNGNVGEAEQAVETISYDNTFNLSEEYDRRKQDRINYFEALKLKRLAENSCYFIKTMVY